jgi:HAD superfamily hydrolase (TIGR01509 family)
VTGLLEFLQKIEDLKIPCAIATSAPRANVDFTLFHTKIERHFPVILDDSFVTRGKPDPEIYLKSAAAVGLEPASCVVFEDSLSGVTAGKRAGASSRHYHHTYPGRAVEADFNINNFMGLEPETVLSRLY